MMCLLFYTQKCALVWQLSSSCTSACRLFSTCSAWICHSYMCVQFTNGCRGLFVVCEICILYVWSLVLVLLMCEDKGMESIFRCLSPEYPSSIDRSLYIFNIRRQSTLKTMYQLCSVKEPAKQKRVREIVEINMYSRKPFSTACNILIQFNSQ